MAAKTKIRIYLKSEGSQERTLELDVPLGEESGIMVDVEQGRARAHMKLQVLVNGTIVMLEPETLSPRAVCRER